MPNIQNFKALIAQLPNLFNQGTGGPSKDPTPSTGADTLFNLVIDCRGKVKHAATIPSHWNTIYPDEKADEGTVPAGFNQSFQATPYELQQQYFPGSETTPAELPSPASYRFIDERRRAERLVSKGLAKSNATEIGRKSKFRVEVDPAPVTQHKLSDSNPTSSAVSCWRLDAPEQAIGVGVRNVGGGEDLRKLFDGRRTAKSRPKDSAQLRTRGPSAEAVTTRTPDQEPPFVAPGPSSNSPPHFVHFSVGEESCAGPVRGHRTRSSKRGSANPLSTRLRYETLDQPGEARKLQKRGLHREESTDFWDESYIGASSLHCPQPGNDFVYGIVDSTTGPSPQVHHPVQEYPNEDFSHPYSINPASVSSSSGRQGSNVYPAVDTGITIASANELSTRTELPSSGTSGTNLDFGMQAQARTTRDSQDEHHANFQEQDFAHLDAVLSNDSIWSFADDLQSLYEGVPWQGSGDDYSSEAGLDWGNIMPSPSQGGAGSIVSDDAQSLLSYQGSSVDIPWTAEARSNWGNGMLSHDNPGSVISNDALSLLSYQGSSVNIPRTGEAGSDWGNSMLSLSHNNPGSIASDVLSLASYQGPSANIPWTRIQKHGSLQNSLEMAHGTYGTVASGISPSIPSYQILERLPVQRDNSSHVYPLVGGGEPIDYSAPVVFSAPLSQQTQYANGPGDSHIPFNDYAHVSGAHDSGSITNSSFETNLPLETNSSFEMNPPYDSQPSNSNSEANGLNFRLAMGTGSADWETGFSPPSAWEGEYQAPPETQFGYAYY